MQLWEPWRRDTFLLSSHSSPLAAPCKNSIWQCGWSPGRQCTGNFRLIRFTSWLLPMAFPTVPATNIENEWSVILILVLWVIISKMNGTIRRNYRGVKKELLERQTSLFIQCMTVRNDFFSVLVIIESSNWILKDYTTYIIIFI